MSYYINQRPSSQAMLAYEGEPSFCNAIQGIRAILAPTGY
jgi:hypothetical protein